MDRYLKLRFLNHCPIGCPWKMHPQLLPAPFLRVGNLLELEPLVPERKVHRWTGAILERPSCPTLISDKVQRNLCLGILCTCHFMLLSFLAKQSIPFFPLLLSPENTCTQILLSMLSSKGTK